MPIVGTIERTATRSDQRMTDRDLRCTTGTIPSDEIQVSRDWRVKSAPFRRTDILASQCQRRLAGRVQWGIQLATRVALLPLAETLSSQDDVASRVNRQRRRGYCGQIAKHCMLEHRCPAFRS